MEKRDRFSLSCLERTQVKHLCQALFHLAKTKKRLQRAGKYSKYKKALMLQQISHIRSRLSDIFTVEEFPTTPKKQPKIQRRDIQSFVDLGYNFSERFRFTSPEQLRRFLTLFQFPEYIRAKSSIFHREELLLISLIRLAYPNRWCDVLVHFPGRKRSECQRAFYWFLDFMIFNWGYLITNNREYWTDKLPASAEAIRLKLASLPNEAYRQNFPPADEPGGFNIALFIDNTMLAMCRPGGGPLTGGENAPRMNKEVQQAWWTGKCSLH